ncbi:MAG: EAL domain-containing protein [Candidatus Dormibacter sp.]
MRTALQTSERLPPALFSLSPFLGTLPIAIIATDLGGIVLAWNAQAEQVYGWSAAEAIGLPIATLVVPPDGGVTPEAILEQLRGGQSWEGEYRIRRRDGRELMLHAVASPLRDEGGDIAAFVGLAVDVTKERQASLAVLEAVIGNCSTSLTVVGADNRVVLTLGDTQMRPIHTMAGEVLGGGIGRKVVELDGRTYDTAAVALPDPVAGPGGVAFVATDITERLAGERRLRALNIVSRLGFMALGLADTAAVFDAAVTSLAAFGLRQVTLYELLGGGESVLVRAVAGEDVRVARGDVIARSAVPMTDQVLLTGEPVRVDDFTTDSRLIVPPGSRFASLGSGLGVPIRVNGETVGALTAHSRADNDFDAHDVDFYESAANVISGAMERSRYENNLRYDATHDRLTSLPNRILLQDRLAQALSRSGRRQSRPLAVLVADLDQFKLVNDSLGHDAADRLLGMAGARLGEAVRPSDTVARVGGDEFVILCEDLVDVTEAATVARRVTERIRDAFLVDGREVSMTMSIGIAVSSEEATVEGLLRDADVAMHRAKERGRGTYELFDDALRTRLDHRVGIEQGLRRALDRDQFVVAYQPIVDVASGRVSEAEAVLRWTRENGRPVAPAEFIPIAEETGMIVPIGAWVLRRACEDAVRWNARFGPAEPVAVSVNLSARQVSHPDLVATVVHALESAGLAPELLRLEITETALMEEGSVGTATLRTLDGLGVRLSVDDFGTGYSSLMYLREYPIRVLKVDRYFVAGLGTNPEDEAIVQAVIALAHSLGLTATAEGVETLEQLRRVRTLECDAAQGYLWSAAVQIDDFMPVVEGIRTSVGDPVARPVPSGSAAVAVPKRTASPIRRGPRRRSHD